MPRAVIKLVRRDCCLILFYYVEYKLRIDTAGTEGVWMNYDTQSCRVFFNHENDEGTGEGGGAILIS